MVRLKIKVWMFVVAALLAIIGCGGGGGSSTSGSSPNSESRSRLFRTLGQSQMALIQGGFQTLGQVGAINGTSGGTTGSGGSVPFVGAFVRNIGSGSLPMGPSRLLGPTREATDTGGDIGTSGSTSAGTDGSTGGEPYFYHDEYLGLWVETTWSDTSSVTLLYLDETKQQPAGSFTSSFTDWMTYPVTSTSTYEITAGPFAGAHGTYETVYESDETGHMEYDNSWPGYGADKGRSEWNASGWDWEYSSNQANGDWSKSTGHFSNQGVGTSVSENSLGYKWTYNYGADGSGNGIIDGPDSGLPAKVSWTAEGHFRVEWADGSEDEWDMWSVISGEGTGGSMGTSTTG